MITMNELIVVLIVVCGVCGGLGAALGSQKEQGGMGFVLGFLLGPFGVLIAALLQDQSGSQSRREEEIRDPYLGSRLRPESFQTVDRESYYGVQVKSAPSADKEPALSAADYARYSQMKRLSGNTKTPPDEPPPVPQKRPGGQTHPSSPSGFPWR